MSYPSTEYVTYSYANPSAHSQGHLHVVAPAVRVESGQRKRPKYTRSKTGCMTCRGKKIKCDETKPNCLRCTHGQRECTWPEGVPSRKRSASRKTRESLEIQRPSTAGSSGLSEQSTPPTRDATPKREAIELSLPPQPSRRLPDPLLHLPSLNGDGVITDRRPSSSAVTQYAYQHGIPPLPMSDRSYSYLQGNDTYFDPRTPRHLPDPRQQYQIPQSLPGHLDPIEPFFPTVQERNLIRHYCDHSLSFIMAVPSENPIVAANLPLILSRTPGSDSAIEALRLSLMGVAAVHRTFLMSRTGVADDRLAEAMAFAHSFRLKSKQHLAKACTTISGVQSDAALGATLAISLMDIFAGGRNWQRNMELAKTLVNVRGGPRVLLARSLATKPRGAEVFHAKLLLEILAVYDIFACFSTGQEPVLLAPDSCSWWYEHTDMNLRHSYVENVFGLSRSFMPLFARVMSFLSRARGTSITEVSEAGVEVINSNIAAECNELYTLLDEWNCPIDFAPRIQAGSLVHKTGLQIALLREVLRIPANDPTIQQSAKAILECCAKCTSGKMAVDLIWPVIIAGCQLYSLDRSPVIEILESFREQCCYEVNTAQEIVLKVWKRMDEDHPKADWRSVMEDFNLSVLIL